MGLLPFCGLNFSWIVISQKVIFQMGLRTSLFPYSSFPDKKFYWKVISPLLFVNTGVLVTMKHSLRICFLPIFSV